jgi:hypothetical protein
MSGTGVYRYGIGRLKLLYARVYRAGGAEPAGEAGLFFGRGLIRTVVCMNLLHAYASFIKGGPNDAEKNVRKGETQWQATAKT